MHFGNVSETNGELAARNNLRSRRYCEGARLKFWRRSRDPKKGNRDEAVEIHYTIPPATQAMRENNEA